MHSTVRLFIRTGIAFLPPGLALGVFMLVRRGIFGIRPAPPLEE